MRCPRSFPNDLFFFNLCVLSPTNKHKGLTLIVYEADNLSSGERPKKEEILKGERAGWNPKALLTSVFSKILLDKGEREYLDYWRFHPLEKVSKECKYPGEEKEAISGEYKNLWEEFDREFHPKDKKINIETCLLLLEK